MSTIGILIADDHPIVRTGIAAMLDGAEDITIRGEVDTPDAAVEFCATHPGEVQVVLMDLRFGEQVGHGQAGGVAATKAIRTLPGPASAPHVLVVTNYSTDADVIGAVNAGAVGYLLKSCTPDELIAGIRTAAQGGSVMSTTIMDKIVGHMAKPMEALTPRETEVLELIARGLSNRQIARELVLTEATVKSHVGRVLTKLGVSNRTAAVTLAQDRGMI